MTNGEDSAYQINFDDGLLCYTGLTKREYFAAMAMQGFCACPDLSLSREVLSEESVKQADDLIKALNKNNNG